jgi:plastocyanin
MFVVLLVAGLSLPVVEAVRATNFTVVMGPTALSFNPPTLTVNQGDTVTWTNASSLTTHTTTSGTVLGGVESPDQLWNGSNPAHGAYTVNFTGYAPRTYPYYCIPHASLGMVGSITVLGTNQQPALVSPAVTAGNQVQFTVNGLIGQTNIVESSPDVVAWSAVSTNLALSTNSAVTGLPAAGNPNGFYRVRVGP